MRKVAPYLFIIILFAVGGWYFFTNEPDPVHELPPPLPPPAASAIVEDDPPVVPEPSYTEADEKPAVEPEPDPLPALYESDALVREALGHVIGPESIQQYLVKDQAITRLVAAFDSLTSRQVPPATNPVKSVQGALVVEEVGDRTVLSEANFARYHAYVDLLGRTDTASILAIYQKLYPLFQQAWEENDGQGSFNDRLVQVIDDLLATPDVSGPIYLVKPEAVYLFEDPVLEGMTAGQKILVRMGSANAATVKNKLQEFRAGLVPGD